jgi:FMN phosphatase YigB (HAD superfamily)
MATNEKVLASWNDTPTRQAIVEFVQSVTEEGASSYVTPVERVAVFDNDGTLWTEKPMPIQLDFLVRRFAEQAERDPSLQQVQPYKAAHEHDFSWLGGAMVKHYHGDDSDMKLLMQAMNEAFAAASIEEYRASADAFFANANHPTLKRPYLTAHYQPMVDLLRYLEANGFTVYIASGGDRDFMRAIGERLYGIPPERVIGSSQALEYREQEDGVDVLYKSEIEFFDDGPTKPVRIWSRIGRRPILAGGNSNGDIPMLRFARSATRPSLRLLLLHDDAEREFDYVAGAEAALERAKAQNWTVVSIKDDWATVFADQA